MKGLPSIAFPKSKHFWFNIYQPGSGLSHLMKSAHLNYGITWRKQSPDVPKCLGAFISFLQAILILPGRGRTIHKLCFGDACECASVLQENSSASLYIGRKKNKRVSKIPALPPTIQIRAADLYSLYVCMHTMSQIEIKIPRKSPCRNDLCNCKSLVTSCESSFALSACGGKLSSTQQGNI